MLLFVPCRETGLGLNKMSVNLVICQNRILCFKNLHFDRYLFAGLIEWCSDICKGQMNKNERGAIASSGRYRRQCLGMLLFNLGLEQCFKTWLGSEIEFSSAVRFELLAG